MCQDGLAAQSLTVLIETTALSSDVHDQPLTIVFREIE